MLPRHLTISKDKYKENTTHIIIKVSINFYGKTYKEDINFC